MNIEFDTHLSVQVRGISWHTLAKIAGTCAAIERLLGCLSL